MRRVQGVVTWMTFLWVGLALGGILHVHQVAALINPSAWRSKASLFMSKMMPVAMRDVVIVDGLKGVIEAGPIPVKERCFVINGWRWHTASVIRDLERFRAVVKSIKRNKRGAADPGAGAGAGAGAWAGGGVGVGAEAQQKQPAQLDATSAARVLGCYQFVCGFNWKALMKVEAEIFFPWLQKLLPDSAISLMEDIVQQHSIIAGLCGKMEAQCQSLSKHHGHDAQLELSTYRKIDDLLVDMQACANKIQSVQESLFVPYIAAFVSKSEQEVFNRMVIKRLGLLDSQVHLVSMYEAIKAVPRELRLYEEQIPSIARAVLPVWRKRLYLPRAGCLHEE